MRPGNLGLCAGRRASGFKTFPGKCSTALTSGKRNCQYCGSGIPGRAGGQWGSEIAVLWKNVNRIGKKRPIPVDCFVRLAAGNTTEFQAKIGIDRYSENLLSLHLAAGGSQRY